MYKIESLNALACLRCTPFLGDGLKMGKWFYSNRVEENFWGKFCLLEA